MIRKITSLYDNIISGRPVYYIGLLAVIIESYAGTAMNTPIELMTDGLSSPVALNDSIFTLRNGDTSRYSKVWCNYDYDDFYHAKKIDKTKSPVTRIDIIAESPRFSCGLLRKYNNWAILPSVAIRKFFFRDFAAEESYKTQAGMAAEKAGISGWYQYKTVSLSLRFGVDLGDKTSLKNIHRKDVDEDYSAMLTLRINRAMISVYSTSEVFSDMNLTVSNTNDSVSITSKIHARYMTFGSLCQLQYPGLYMDCSIDYSSLKSDTQSISSNILPTVINTDIIHAKLKAEWNKSIIKPYFKAKISIAHPAFSGYDKTGGTRYFYLDKNSALLTNAEIGGKWLLDIKSGLTAEYMNLSNNKAGRFDPYMFSSMTFFVPTKYKIDSLKAKYMSLGMFVEREQPVYRWWQLYEFLSVSRLKVQSTVHTREYDFTYIIARLINPQTVTLFDEDIILFILNLHNNFSLDSKSSIMVGIQQAIPLSIKNGNISTGSGEASGGSNSSFLSVRGGTRYSIGFIKKW
jgi:hypothetical protein